MKQEITREVYEMLKPNKLMDVEMQCTYYLVGVRDKPRAKRTDGARSPTDLIYVKDGRARKIGALTEERLAVVNYILHYTEKTGGPITSRDAARRIENSMEDINLKRASALISWLIKYDIVGVK
jgi:hypothetical protein